MIDSNAPVLVLSGYENPTIKSRSSNPVQSLFRVFTLAGFFISHSNNRPGPGVDDGDNVHRINECIPIAEVRWRRARFNRAMMGAVGAAKQTCSIKLFEFLNMSTRFIFLTLRWGHGQKINYVQKGKE